MNTPPIDIQQRQARQQLRALCQAMLAGELSFFEGALQAHALQGQTGITEDDPDIRTLAVIVSETDHLPPRAIQHRWSAAALARLQPEFMKTEEWARKFAEQACSSLVARLSD
ncbi:DUF2489 domain-containing protein [Vogesella sp. LIG4]|uniref:DUF2489 domain-containing protein n=1 Tax=Vogesella sp. LIG4 TaxID=1192162 RepID=UPI00081F8B66|nr:DUF2489 domain-containing protein [Vogesella sp. LIG4]SCK15827.1 Protein of unknown function [Vogesella sp. LIG4]